MIKQTLIVVGETRDTGLDVSEVWTVMLDNIELYGVKSSEGYLRNAT